MRRRSTRTDRRISDLGLIAAFVVAQIFEIALIAQFLSAPPVLQ
jgi:hypothetical protein